MEECTKCGRFIDDLDYEDGFECNNKSCPNKSDGGSFIVSAVIGAVTGSAILGGIIGGDIVGGILGDSLDGDLFD